MAALEVSLGRSALLLGFERLGLEGGDALAAPDFICDVVWDAARRRQIDVAPYTVHDDFSPRWDTVEAAVSSPRARALLMLHYFGQPQDVTRYRGLCARRRLFLVEDNAHGFSGRLDGQALGTLGDIGFASPRKFMGTRSGGVLYFGEHSGTGRSETSLPPFRGNAVVDRVRLWLAGHPAAASRMRGVRNMFRNWSDPRLFREAPGADHAIDPGASRRLASTDWPAVASRRRDAWKRWARFAIEHGLRPAFADVHPESCPWALPVYAPTIRERNRWLRWGARHGFTVFPWPALPEPVIAAAGDAYRRWERLCCFLLDQPPR
jgi:hypothetical protein